jgi:hypothetical protein
MKCSLKLPAFNGMQNGRFTFLRDNGSSASFWNVFCNQDEKIDKADPEIEMAGPFTRVI